jgi:hypothetical protein
VGVSPFSGKNDNELPIMLRPGFLSVTQARLLPGPGVESVAEFSNRYSVHLLPPA